MAEQEMRAVMATLNLSVQSIFVPYSRSRNAPKGNDKGWLSLNWQVTIIRDQRPILTTEYSQGAGHCPANKSFAKQPKGTQRLAIEWECENGRAARGDMLAFHGGQFRPMFQSKPLLPNEADVMWALVSDADVLEYRSFEDWAETFGFDPDSRKAEKMYRACLDIALALRSAVGDEGLRLLREAGQDY